MDAWCASSWRILNRTLRDVDEVGFGRDSSVSGDGYIQALPSEGVTDGGVDGDVVLGGGRCLETARIGVLIVPLPAAGVDRGGGREGEREHASGPGWPAPSVRRRARRLGSAEAYCLPRNHPAVTASLSPFAMAGASCLSPAPADARPAGIVSADTAAKSPA